MSLKGIDFEWKFKRLELDTKNKVMEATVRKLCSMGKTTQRTEPKKLSKAGQWMRDHPKGIFEIVDRRAVNK